MSESAPRWVGRWAGGRIKEARGRRLWVIERQVTGVRRAVVLDVNSERDALAELALFERDPMGFRTRQQGAAAEPGAARIDGGEAVLREVNDPCGIAGKITFRHLKAGNVHVVSVDAQTFAVARRLRRRGSPLSRNAAKVMLDRAAKRLDARRIHPSELRHSFATWARAEGHIVRPTEGGVPLAEVAAVMGHLTPRTTKVFYEGNELPPMIALPLRLHHPSDPVPLDVARNSSAVAQ